MLSVRVPSPETAICRHAYGQSGPLVQMVSSAIATQDLTAVMHLFVVTCVGCDSICTLALNVEHHMHQVKGKKVA